MKHACTSMYKCRRFVRVKATSAVKGDIVLVSSCSWALMLTLKPQTTLSGVLCSLPLLISKQIVRVSPSTLITSLGHPAPSTDLLPKPKVLPPYSPIFLFPVPRDTHNQPLEQLHQITNKTNLHVEPLCHNHIEWNIYYQTSSIGILPQES